MANRLTNRVVDLSSEYVLLLIIIVLIYYFVNRCSCKDSFRVGAHSYKTTSTAIYNHDQLLRTSDTPGKPWSKSYMIREFGISSNSYRIVYDTKGLLSPPHNFINSSRPETDDQKFLNSYGITNIVLYKSNSLIYDYGVKIYIESPNLNTKWYEFNYFIEFNFFIKGYNNYLDYEKKINACDDDSYNLTLNTLGNHEKSEYNGLVDFNLDCKAKHPYMELWKIEFKKVLA